MKLHLIDHGDEWEVWISLPETTDPRRSNEAFIIGTGPTKQKAMLAAALELTKGVGDLVAGMTIEQGL